MSKIYAALEALAHRDIPENTDLWPRIAAQARKDAYPVNSKLKFTWTALLVLLALALATTAGYALYRYFFDPGLQSVNEAGLITDLNATAQPTPITDATPMWGQPQPATQIGESQTLEDVTVTLGWVYVEDSHQAIGFSANGLKSGLRLGLLSVTYAGVTPEQFSGATMVLDENGNGLMVTYQIVREGVVDSKVDVGIDIPLLRDGKTIATFHFDVANAPVDMTGGGGGNAYAVRINGVEMRQEYVIVAPDYTAARLCYPLPSAKDWQVEDVSVQFADKKGELIGEPVAADRISPVKDTGEERCVEVNFPAGDAAGKMVVYVKASALVAPDEKLDGGWMFGTVIANLINVEGATPATPTPAVPLDSKTIGDLKATLDWAYADANRVAFGFHFDGWKENYFFNGISLLDANGDEINASTGSQPTENDPSRLMLDFEPVNELIGERFKGQLVLMVSNDQVNFTSFAEYHFDLDLPLYPAVTLEPLQKVSANGLEILLQKVRTTPSFTYAYLCFSKPTTGDFSDWQVAYQGTQLKIGQDEAPMYTSMLLFDSDMGDVGKGPEYGWKTPIETGRCLKLGFPVGHHDQPETLTLTIPQLEKSMPEVIPNADVKKAQEILKAQGIEMTYTTFTGNGGGGGGPLFTKKPVGMDDARAYQKFIEALGYVYKGPWVITVNINP
jgi:hypothetical protein